MMMKENKRIIKGGLTRKLFVLLLLTFILVFAITFLWVHFYFESFYVEQQIKNQQKDVKNYLQDKDIKGTHLMKTLEEIVTDYSLNNPHPLVLVDGHRAYYPSRRQSIILKNEEGTFDVLLGDALYQLNNSNQRVEINKEFSIVGFWGAKEFFGISLYDLTEDEKIRAYQRYGLAAGDIKTIKGRVVEIDLPNYRSGSLYQQDIIYQQIQARQLTYTVDQDIEIITMVDAETGTHNYLVIMPHEEMLAVTIYSVHPIEEIIAFIPSFFTYVLLFATIIVVILLGIVTKIVVDPIVNINRIARDISQLNFGNRLPVKTADEIGMISSSINKMADKLEMTLNELEDHNLELSDNLVRKERYELARKRFVADVSHELKTPLGIISAYTERLEDKYITDKEGRRYTAVILDENKKMTRLINNLLELSKLESDNYVLKKEWYDIGEDIEDTVERFRPLFEEKGVDLSVQLQVPVMVHGDMELMHQVVSNMISNAMKYVPEHGEVEVSLIKEDGIIKFCIANKVNDKENIDLDHIWDRFYKADHSRNREKGGVGLGLAISKTVLDLHGFTSDVSFDNDRIKFCFLAL